MGLKERLIARITAAGPISLADYMAECLMDPTEGYYTNRDPFGTDGDFTTAPEISQMFGELLGLSLAQTWLDQGKPAPFALVELGPGRGTLMTDVLRATRPVPGFHDALELHLIEGSPTLRARQRERLPDARWHDTLDTVPDLPVFAIANEFFDALPIRQFVRAGDHWQERRVGIVGGQLGIGLAGPAPQPFLQERLQDTSDSDIVEISPMATAVAATLGQRIEDSGGAALIVDYGDWRSLGDTFQALTGHAPSDPFAAPGGADLTAHVDFEAIAMAAPCARSKLTTQGVFLERLGITQRAQTLAQRLSGPQLDAHIAAHRRLTHPEEMGTLFKVLGLFPTASAPPPGLDV